MYEVVDKFEKALAEYTGAKYAVTVDSCTNALTLCCDFALFNSFGSREFFIPKHTYISVPQSILNAGGEVTFTDDNNWQKEGRYELWPWHIWDSARLLTSGMHQEYETECLSFHWGKTLNLGQGGAILTDDKEAYEYFKKARWDGRTPGVPPKDDEITFIGRHCPMSPRDAADALTRLHFLPKHNKPLPIEPNYPDLSKMEVFKCG